MTNKRMELVKSTKTTYLLFLFKIFKFNLFKNDSADYFLFFCIEFLYSQGNYINDKSHSTISLNYRAGSRNSVVIASKKTSFINESSSTRLIIKHWSSHSFITYCSTLSAS